jgi:hypothetical protein
LTHSFPIKELCIMNEKEYKNTKTSFREHSISHDTRQERVQHGDSIEAEDMCEKTRFVANIRDEEQQMLSHSRRITFKLVPY